MGLILPERIPDPSIADSSRPDIRWTNSDGEEIGQPGWTILPGKLEEFTPLYWEGPEMTRIADALERIADALEGVDRE